MLILTKQQFETLIEHYTDSGVKVQNVHESCVDGNWLYINYQRNYSTEEFEDVSAEREAAIRSARSKLQRLQREADAVAIPIEERARVQKLNEPTKFERFLHKCAKPFFRFEGSMTLDGYNRWRNWCDKHTHPPIVLEESPRYDELRREMWKAESELHAAERAPLQLTHWVSHTESATLRVHLQSHALEEAEWPPLDREQITNTQFAALMSLVNRSDEAQVNDFAEKSLKPACKLKYHLTPTGFILSGEVSVEEYLYAVQKGYVELST